MHYEKLFPSKYLKATDLDGRDVVVRIRSVLSEPVQSQEGESEDKPVVHFHGTDKRLVLNKTNADTIAGLYGPEVDRWANRPVTLFVQHGVQAFGKSVDALRVRPEPPPGSAVAHSSDGVQTTSEPPPSEIAAEPPLDPTDGELPESAGSHVDDSDDLPF